MLKLVFNPLTSNFDYISTVTLAAVGSSPSANAATIDPTTQVLILQPADATHPGVLTTGSQTIAGTKTFSSLLNADGGVDRSTAGTLSFGTNSATATTINIGNSTATVNIQGTTIFENTTTLNISNPVINVNTGGGVASASNSGVAVEENSIVTGYVETSADRNSWILKAPNTAGIATITPGASGITIDQSSHNPVTLGTANGLSLSTQVLSLALSSTSTTGALSSTDWNTFNGKQAAGNYITALTGDVTATGPGSVAATIAANAVTNAKLAQMAAHTYKGNNTGSTANAADITSTQLTADLNLFTTSLQGLVPASGGGTTNFLRADGTFAAPASFTPVAPTVQRFTTGSGTYTKPTSPSPLYIKVKVVGAGGGGGGGGVGGATGTAGGTTTFGSSFLTANGGGAGSANSGGTASSVGGTATIGAGATGTVVSGGDGAPATGGGAGNTPGGNGGSSALGGAGAGAYTGSGGTSISGTGKANTGGGGGGGGGTAVAGASGGGAGGFIEAIVTSISSTYAYAIGTGGNGAAAGTSGSNGAAGGDGYIEVIEYYQ